MVWKERLRKLSPTIRTNTTWLAGVISLWLIRRSMGVSAMPSVSKAIRAWPFGLPGVNKSKKVSNGNYLWISYFWSYLSEKGRAGFVMSSQASSAGHGERDVRKKIVESGDVDVMISIRSNFFYTRSVPCELWFF